MEVTWLLFSNCLTNKPRSSCRHCKRKTTDFGLKIQNWPNGRNGKDGTAAQREVLSIAQTARHAKRRAMKAARPAFYLHEVMPTPEVLVQAMAERNARVSGSYHNGG
jgi:hypothetical protein